MTDTTQQAREARVTRWWVAVLAVLVAVIGGGYWWDHQGSPAACQARITQQYQYSGRVPPPYGLPRECNGVPALQVTIIEGVVTGAIH